MDNPSPILVPRNAPPQNKGTVSRQPIRRVVWRRRFDADARGAVHFALAEHEPKPGHDRGRLFLHLHVEHAHVGRSRYKPAALNVPQLAGLIRCLQGILDEMSPNGPKASRELPADDTGEPPRRVRGRRADRGDDAETDELAEAAD